MSWTVVRLDSAFDVYEERTELLMWLLNQSLDLSNKRKKFKRVPLPGNPEENQYKSSRFKNKTTTYNVYVKIREIQDKIEQQKDIVADFILPDGKYPNKLQT